LLCFWSNKISRLSINPIFQLTFKKLHLILELAKQNIYKVVDECKATISFGNGKIYFKKSNVESLKDYDSKTYMIECKYNQEHGLMHDCNVKVKSI
uniref:hypothetical protein n=1 Tax=Sulfurimonas sp. TaxID=2022749 RepID=UPI0025E83D62